MMVYQPVCGDLEPHDSHQIIDMHFKSRYCGGVCGCGISRYSGPHGPGEHK